MGRVATNLYTVVGREGRGHEGHAAVGAAEQHGRRRHATDFRPVVWILELRVRHVHRPLLLLRFLDQ